MMDASDFERNNQAFLQAALRWLRARLQATPLPPPPAAAPRGHWWHRQRPALPPAAGPAGDPVATARTAMDAAAQVVPAPAFVELAQRLGLSAFEQDMLLLAAAMEIDPGLPALVAVAQGDPALRCPTFGLGMARFAQPSWEALAPERPLRALRLVEVHQSGCTPLLGAALRIDERVAAYVKGLNYLDERLAALARRVPASAELPPSQEAVAQAVARWLAPEASVGVLQLTGTPSAAKADVAARAAALAGRQLLALPFDALPIAADDAASFERLWSREARLQRLALLVEDVEAGPQLSGEEPSQAVQGRWPRALARLGLPCLLDVRQPLSTLQSLVHAVAAPTVAERRALWRSALTIGDTAPDQAAVARLAGEFQLGASSVWTVAHQVQAQAADGTGGSQGGRPAFGRAWEACVRQTGAALAAVTRWVTPRARLRDLQLPGPEREQIERLIAHARQRVVVTTEFGFADRGERGLGITALFHGESGTGKTLAAEAVAHELRLGLAVVDLATVKSKYIGETEKNLRRVFDAAEGGGAVLMFDEADALFGKRSEVRDSHDRYANIEIDYLLQRMESFSGVALLATNQKHALDPAFLRRIKFVVGFPFPGVAERRAIWETVFPQATPRGELDFGHLARFQLTGGSIFNAAVAAAHAAAAAGTKVGMPQVLEAVRWELRKLERLAPEAEFLALSANAVLARTAKETAA